MTSKFIDLLLLAEGVVLLFLAVGLEASPAAVRVVLGLMFVLFFPGYALMAALFPRRQDLEPVERIALSFGLSLAIVPLVGLLLNYIPWGIRLWPILISLSIFVGLCTVVAAFRRVTLPQEEAFVLTLPTELTHLRHLNILSVVSALVLTASLAALGTAIYLAATSSGRSEKFTEFYVLGSGGKAEGYAKELAVEEKAKIILGVANHEGGQITYRIETRLPDGVSAGSTSISLDDGERRELPMSLSVTKAGSHQRLDFILYKDGEAGGPYRSLHLFVDVTEALGPTPNGLGIPASPTGTRNPAAAQTVAPQPTASPPPAQTATPPPSLPPALLIADGGLVHVVLPGETLTSISARYGLLPTSVLTANGLGPSDGLLAGQRLSVPGVAYVVVDGDTISVIAGRFGVSINAIIAANALSQPSLIASGQVLAIPRDIP